MTLFWRARGRAAPFPAVALAAVALAAFATHDAAAQRRRNVRSDYRSQIDTTLAFDKNGSVNIDAANGEIVVSGWSRSEVRVHAVSDHGDIRLGGSASRLMLSVNPRGGDTRFEVSVPYGVRVEAHAQSGDIDIRGTRGQVEAHAQSGDVKIEDVTTRLDVNSVSGDVTVANVTGDASINTVSGGVTLTQLRGNVDIGTVSGDVDLRGISARTVRATTTSGEITYDGSIDPAGRYELHAHSGDIRLRIPRDANAQITVSTWNGSFDSQFPITLKPGEQSIGLSKTKRYTFEVGGGAARITAETFSGDITVSSNGRGAR